MEIILRNGIDILMTQTDDYKVCIVADMNRMRNTIDNNAIIFAYRELYSDNSSFWNKSRSQSSIYAISQAKQVVHTRMDL